MITEACINTVESKRQYNFLKSNIVALAAFRSMFILCSIPTSSLDASNTVALK